jgi:citrate synthase
MVFLKQHIQWVFGCFNKCTYCNPKSVNVDNEKEMYNAVCKTMGILVIATWTYRKTMGYPLNYYDNTKGYVENFN